MPIYLDYNATTPVRPEVLDDMIFVYRQNFGNAGSRTHSFGQAALAAVEKARGQIASVLGCEKDEVVFTSGATESNNIAILGLAQWGSSVGRRHIISSMIEHKSVMEPMRYLSRHGFEVELVGVNKDGAVDLDDLKKRVRQDTLLVSIMHANNETGVIQPVDKVAKLLEGSGAYLHCDAAQTFGKLVPEVRGLRYDLLSISGHKMGGPQGIGTLVMRRRNYKKPPVEPVLFGGGQEHGIRPGTLPVALIAGFGKATEISEKEYAGNHARCMKVKESILKQLEGTGCIINGSLEHSLPNCINISFPKVNSEALMILIKDHVCVSNGSACTSAEYRPSHVLTAMGLEDSIAKGAIRMSWGYGVGEVDLSPLIQAVKALQ